MNLAVVCCVQEGDGDTWNERNKYQFHGQQVNWMFIVINRCDFEIISVR